MRYIKEGDKMYSAFMSCGHGVNINITSKTSTGRRCIRIFDSCLAEAPDGTPIEVPVPFDARAAAADIDLLIVHMMEGRMDGMKVGETINGLLK